MKRGKNWGRVYASCAVELKKCVEQQSRDKTEGSVVIDKGDSESFTRCGFFMWIKEEDVVSSTRTAASPKRRKTTSTHVVFDDEDKEERHHDNVQRNDQDDVGPLLDDASLRDHVQKMLNEADLTTEQIYAFTTSKRGKSSS